MYKKIVISIIAVVVVAALAALAYWYWFPKTDNQPASNNVNPAGQTVQVGAEDNGQDNPAKTQIKAGVVAEGANGNGTLTICEEKCGDGVCQRDASSCDSGSVMCACVETPAECPSDCK